MNRHEQRVKMMEALYQYKLLKKELADVADELHCEDETANSYFYDVFEKLHASEEEYIELINSNLKDWTFDRLGYCEQAILLVALTELKGLGYDKPVVINEAVTLAKKYCDEESYRLINGVLDQL